MSDKPRVISLEEQQTMGLRREPGNFVVPAQARGAELPPTPRHEVVLDVVPSSQAAIHVHTSAVDGALGHVISNSVLGFVIGLAMAIGLPYLKGSPILTIMFLVYVTGAMAVVHLVTWLVAQVMSPEGVMFYEATQKWKVIKGEQRERHAYYRRLEKK